MDSGQTIFFKSFCQALILPITSHATIKKQQQQIIRLGGTGNSFSSYNARALLLFYMFFIFTAAKKINYNNKLCV